MLRRQHEGRPGRRFTTFTMWLEETVREREREGVQISDELRSMSRLPYPTVEHYNSMYAYGYHFRTDAEQGRSSVSYDSGVAAIITQECRSSRADRNPVEAALQYVGIITDILKVNYGALKYNVLRCSWIRPDLEGPMLSMREDVHGFWSVKFNARMPTNIEPFILPSHAQQVSHRTLFRIASL